MKALFHLLVSSFLTLSFASFAVENQPSESELIPDNHFHRGFVLWETKPGKHVRYGELQGLDSTAKPVWGLSQWSSKFPLTNTITTKVSEGVLVYHNTAKTVTLGAAGTIKADLSLAANAGVEYGDHVRVLKDPWVHLLVEQEFEPVTSLHELNAAKLHIEIRLLHSRLINTNGYHPGVHAAQFQIFFTVQNRNHASAGYGDLLWFGVPIYDNRHRDIPEFKAQDFGETTKFIFTPAGTNFTATSTHDGKWVSIDQDLLPLMRESLETAWARGYLKDSKLLSDYFIGGIYMGWELPGSFEVEIQVRNLSLKTARKK